MSVQCWWFPDSNLRMDEIISLKLCIKSYDHENISNLNSGKIEYSCKSATHGYSDF